MINNEMGDAFCSKGACTSSPPLSSCRHQPWRAYNSRYRAQPRRALLFASRKWPISPVPTQCHSLACHGMKVPQKEIWTLHCLTWASSPFRLRLTARASDLDKEAGKNVDARPLNATQYPLNEAPFASQIYMEAQTNRDVMPLPDKGLQQADIQYINLTKDASSSNKHMATNKQEADRSTNAPQRSLEEDYGLLKEQVESDRRIQLASKQDSDVESITDTAKPLKRSKIIAKQVISQSSARLIGFVSQLWVSVRLFRVVALEVRPSLLFGEIDRVFLAHVCQIGDVVLVSDESALENEITALDCETLVGYDVVTEDGNYIGKIRDYSFDLQDGKLTSLDFDSVGFSLVPSSLISTYRLDAEEVMEVLADSILVKEGVESRIRRLTKGFWQLPNAGEKRRSQKTARSRMQNRRFSESTDFAGQARPLPSSMRSRYFGLDAREEPADRGFPKDYDRSPRSRDQ